MKKILFSLIALVCSMSMNAQVMVIMKDGVTVKTYTVAEADEVVFQESMPKTGVAIATINGRNVKKNWIQLWENGPKFAEHNIGATSITEYGGYFAWGGIEDKADDHNTGSESLSGNNDTATYYWGSNWRMPTQTELQALVGNCTAEWTTVNGINGCRFTGKGDYASCSIFLPAASFCENGIVGGQGYSGHYWSSTTTTNPYNYFGYYLFLGTDEQAVYSFYREYGCSVRAVLAE